jgi:TonB family protein
MHALSFVALLLVAIQVGFGQTAISPQSGQQSSPGLPSDPRDVISEARPLYDFADATLKPWHLKASYQLYDDRGAPGEQGTFEFWWAAPDVNRTLWTRAGSTHSDWSLGGNKYASRSEGEPLKYFENKLRSALLDPLPAEKSMDPTRSRIERKDVSVGSAKLPCIMVGPIIGHFGQAVEEPIGLFPTYCFDPHSPVLLLSYALGGVTEVFSKIAKVQGKYLAREVTFFQGKSATVDSVAGLNPTDAGLAAPEGVPVSSIRKVNVSGGFAVGMLLKKAVPVYPQDAKDNRISGTVVLQAVIGTDGGVHDLQVISAPWPSLAASALWAVSHWEYRPYLLNGDPVEVETTVNVVFTLGN